MAAQDVAGHSQYAGYTQDTAAVRAAQVTNWHQSGQDIIADGSEVVTAEIEPKYDEELRLDTPSPYQVRERNAEAGRKAIPYWNQVARQLLERMHHLSPVGVAWAAEAYWGAGGQLFAVAFQLLQLGSEDRLPHILPGERSGQIAGRKRLRQFVGWAEFRAPAEGLLGWLKAVFPAGTRQSTFLNALRTMGLVPQRLGGDGELRWRMAEDGAIPYVLEGRLGDSAV